MRYALAIFLCLTVAAACSDNDSTTPRSSQASSETTSFRVEGAAMAPTLEDGDVVQVLQYEGRMPERGDIVVFRPPPAPDRDFIKRIIGLPGETVEIDASTGTVSVDGEPLPEPYVKATTSCTQVCTWRVPDAGGPEARNECQSDRCYYVLGDNRPNSSDSRQGWLVPAENIRGFVEVD